MMSTRTLSCLVCKHGIDWVHMIPRRSPLLIPFKWEQNSLGNSDLWLTKIKAYISFCPAQPVARIADLFALVF